MVIILGIALVLFYLLGVFDESLSEKIARKERERLEMSECWNVEEYTEEYK